MSFTDEEIKRAADLKLWIESRIAELETEVSRLRETLSVVDAVLRAASFRPASALPVGASQEPEEPRVIAARTEAQEEVKETRQLTRAKDRQVLAAAHISRSKVVIVPSEGLDLRTAIPPFKSFFVNRILEGMKAKDAQAVAQNKLKPGEMIRYQISEEDGTILRLDIENYRDRSRLNEIVNTATWVFSRMLEKKG